jgi:hypothetical protein
MAGPYDSPYNTYTDTTAQKRVITDVVSLIDPSDAPAVERFGGLDGASGKFRFVNGNGTSVEWLEDTLLSLSDSLTASVTGSNTLLGITDATIFEKGQLIQIDSEIMWVSAVDTTNNSATVTRAAAGTSTASHTTAAIAIVGMARLEGADSDAIGFTDKYSGQNYTQIFHQEVKLSRSSQQISQYGIADELAYQCDKIVPSQMRLIERTFFRSKGSSAGNATTPRIMGGYQAFVSTNKVSGATLAQSQFDSAVKTAYLTGGTGPWVALVSPTNLVKVKNFYDNSSFLNITRDEGTVGMHINTVMTPFGPVELVLDRWATDTEIGIFDPKNVGFKTYYPFTQEPLAKTGDYDRAQVVGEFTLCVRQDKSHAVLTNVS